MQKTILTILASVLLTASTVQFAAAAEHHRVRKIFRTPAPMGEPFRNSNAYDSNAFYSEPAPWAQPGWSRYENGAESAPAGR